MKNLLTLSILLCFPALAHCQNAAGRVVVQTIDSKTLANARGEKSVREIAIYLPDGYDQSDHRYPVIYFLHGFSGDHRILQDMSPLLDDSIRRNKIRPFIMVVSNQNTSYGGSFYCDSDVFGRWERFTVFDVVDYVDQHFRTIASRKGRGIAGHSMGGYGAMRISMRHPDRFSSVYALSPGALAIVKEYGPDSDTYRELEKISTTEQLQKSYFPKVAIAFGKSWSPNLGKPPFHCDVPFSYTNKELVVDQDVLKKWHQNMPYYMIDNHLENLRRLDAIKLDWGRNAGDRFTLQCDMFSRKLEDAGVDHFAEEYIGTHGSNIYTSEGRIPNQMLPFFNDYLSFGQ